jgi:phage shock protein A
MTTPQTPQAERATDYTAQKLDAEVREAEGRLQAMQARAEARKAKAEMDEISGLTAAKERVKKEVASLKQQAAADYAATKHMVEQDIKALQADIQRVSEKYTAWDAARERRFYAQLDEAEARLKVWKAQAQRKQAEHTMKAKDDLATLEEQIALARASAAAARSQRYSAEAWAALEDAARHFDEAYDAAAKRYEKK